MKERPAIRRLVLPIPGKPHIDPTIYGARTPEMKLPPIRDIPPPAGTRRGEISYFEERL